MKKTRAIDGPLQKNHNHNESRTVKFKGLQSTKSPGVWIVRISGYSQANPHLQYLSRVALGHTEEIRGLPVEYLSTTSHLQFQCILEGENPVTKGHAPASAQWAAGSSGTSGTGHSPAGEGQHPWETGHWAGSVFPDRFASDNWCIGIWKPDFCAYFGRGKKSTHTEGLLHWGCYLLLFMLFLSQEKIAALCAKPFKPKCRFRFACGFPQGNPFCTKVTQLPTNAVLPSSRSQPNANSYIKYSAIQLQKNPVSSHWVKKHRHVHLESY